MSPPACDTPFEHVEFKAKRAKARLRSLHQKKAEYLQSKHLPPSASANACRQEQPHRSARTMTRTSLSKGAVEFGTDVPCIVMNGAEKASAWSRKPKVLPQLRCKRKGSIVSVDWQVSPNDERISDDSSISVMSQVPSPVTFGDVLASRGAGRITFESKVDITDDFPLAVIEDCDSEFEKLCMLCEELGGSECCDSDSAGDAILGVMCNYPHVAKLQNVGFRALELLASRKGYKHLVEFGCVVPTLINVMRNHGSSETLQTKGCRLLGCIVACGAECRNIVASAGGIQVVLAAMTTHESSVSVHEAGCRALKELAALKDSIQEEIASQSGIEAVLKTMDLQKLSADIQTAACGVLRNMSAGNQPHQDKIVSLGGVSKVCMALVEHGHNATVQWAGIWTIFCLALQNPTSKAEIFNNGCISLVLQAMMVHLNVQRVQEAGFWALKELASLIDSDSLRSECIQMVSTSLSVHCSEELKKVGRLVLRKLFARSGNAFSVRVACQSSSVVESGQHLMIKKRRFADLPTIKE